KGMSKEQKAQYEAALKQRSEAMKKNKALNDAFNAGQNAIKQAQAEPDKTKRPPMYQTASDNFNKAGEMDANQVAVWDSLGEAYSNMGANLVNAGSADKASNFFKKATDAGPSYAEAWYQLGSTLMMKGSVDPKTGKQAYPPDTGPALQKYMELQPNGPHAQEAT